MIGNVYRGDGFRGLVDYLASKEGSLLLDTNLDGASPEAFSRQVGEVRQLHPKENLAKPVCHIPLRPVPGEDLSDEQWHEVLHLALERMGFASSPYVAYLHDHGDGRHLHIATYRVTFEGTLVSDSNDRYRIMAVAREIEREYGLAVARAQHPIHLTRPSLERLLRDPDRAKAFATIRRAIDQAASRHDTVRAFLTELHRLGIPAEIKAARKTGTLQGIRFALPDGQWVKGSHLGKDYSLSRICNRHELRIERRPEGRYVAATEITEKEHRMLRRDGLEPDQTVRYGNRRTLFWELPKDLESGFVDLLAARLPHRFLHFTDGLPRPLEEAPDLAERARRVRLLWELVEAGPGIAPPLPASGSGQSDGGMAVAAVEGPGETAVRCQELSLALEGEVGLPPASAAALRAQYHEAMIAALAGHRPAKDRGIADEPSGSVTPVGAPLIQVQPPELEPAQVPTRPGVIRQIGEIEPAQLSPTPGPLPAPEQREPVRIGGADEARLAARYEREGSLASFQEWARLQQTLRRADRGPQPSALPRPQTDRAALRELAVDLGTAHRRFAAEASAGNRAEVVRRLEAYETLARRLDRLGSRPAGGPRPARRRKSLESLKTDLLAAHDRYLAGPTAETETEWRHARRRYEAAVRESPPARPEVASASLAGSVARERTLQKALASRLGEEERRFLEAPHDPVARQGWVEALSALRASEDRLATAQRLRLESLERGLRQSASTLAFYEQAYFRSPSALTERLWRRAEREHLRASLELERERLRLPVRLEPSREERPVVRAAASLKRIFEKEALGRDVAARSLAARAARAAWARTPLGRTALAAAHPLRALAQASPAATAAVAAADAGSEALRRSLVLYTELRAAEDRLRATGLARGKRDLFHGDLSSRSLAGAVVRYRVAVAPPATASVSEAVRGARSAEAALVRSYRSFRKGLADEPALTAAAARALAARSTVTASIHRALGIPSYRDFTAVLGSRQGRALTAWIGTLERAGLSARAIAGSVAEIVPTALSSAAAAVAIVGARRIVRWVAGHLRSQALEILREQNEQRR